MVASGDGMFFFLLKERKKAWAVPFNLLLFPVESDVCEVPMAHCVAGGLLTNFVTVWCFSESGIIKL